MKLAVTDIRISAFNTLCATIDVEVEHGKSIYSVCSMDVSVPLVDGRAVKDHEEELKNKAREVITKMYKEIVSKHCSEHSIARGNQLHGSFQDAVSASESKAFKVEHGKITINTSQVESISPSSKDNLEERVALLEKRLGEQTSPDMLKTIHEVSKKAAQGFLSQGELKKKIEHDVNGESFTFYSPDGTVRLQIGRCDEYSVGFPFRITDKCGQLFVHDEEGVRPPTHKHSDAIIDRVIRDLKSENGNMLKRLGRCMGLLQVAAEIEAVSQICESECERCRESILSDFDNPPFKNAPIGWISPGVKYLKRRI